MALKYTVGAWWATQTCTVPTPPRYLPCPQESGQCWLIGISMGNSFSISSTSGARPKGHQGKPKELGVVDMAPVQIMTALLVAARSSGLSTVPRGIRNSIGAKVALEMGRS